MTDDTERLVEALHAHEHLAPDVTAVWAATMRRARVLRRRRTAARAAGGAVLGAGIATASLTVPGELGHNQAPRFGMAPAVGPSPTGSVSLPSLPPSEQQQDLSAYFAAGYGYEDAVKLAKLWHAAPGDIAAVKAEAGRRLLAGQKLPVAAHPNPTGTGTASPATEADLDAFFAAGYGYDDAVQLAHLWHSSDTYQVKIDAGRRLLAGEKLPVSPHPSSVGDTTATRADVDEFFAAGYTYDDAVRLSHLWNRSDVYQVKALAGHMLRAGDTLPIKP